MAIHFFAIFAIMAKMKIARKSMEKMAKWREWQKWRKIDVESGKSGFVILAIFTKMARKLMARMDKMA